MFLGCSWWMEDSCWWTGRLLISPNCARKQTIHMFTNRQSGSCYSVEESIAFGSTSKSVSPFKVLCLNWSRKSQAPYNILLNKYLNIFIMSRSPGALKSVVESRSGREGCRDWPLTWSLYYAGTLVFLRSPSFILHVGWGQTSSSPSRIAGGVEKMGMGKRVNGEVAWVNGLIYDTGWKW